MESKAVVFPWLTSLDSKIHLQRRYVHELASLRSENSMRREGEMGLSSQKLDMEKWVIRCV